MRFITVIKDPAGRMIPLPDPFLCQGVGEFSRSRSNGQDKSPVVLICDKDIYLDISGEDPLGIFTGRLSLNLFIFIHGLNKP